MPDTTPMRSALRAKPATGLQSQVRYAASQRYQASPVLKPLKAKGNQRGGQVLRTIVKRRPDRGLTPENDHEFESLAWTAPPNRRILRAASGTKNRGF